MSGATRTMRPTPRRFAGRPGQRFVPVRLVDNQAELMRHRARELLAGQRTSLLNALRGHLAEIGVVAAQGVQHAYALKRLAADGFDDNGEIVVPDCVRVALRPIVGQIDALDEAIAAIDKVLAASVTRPTRAAICVVRPDQVPSQRGARASRAHTCRHGGVGTLIFSRFLKTFAPNLSAITNG